MNKYTEKIQKRTTNQVCEPKPYHMSWSISNSRPTMIVCLLPRERISTPSTTWAQTERMPTTAMNTATMSSLNPITCRQQTLTLPEPTRATNYASVILLITHTWDETWDRHKWQTRIFHWMRHCDFVKLKFWLITVKLVKFHCYKSYWVWPLRHNFQKQN